MKRSLGSGRRSRLPPTLCCKTLITFHGSGTNNGRELRVQGNLLSAERPLSGRVSVFVTDKEATWWGPLLTQAQKRGDPISFHGGVTRGTSRQTLSAGTRGRETDACPRASADTSSVTAPKSAGSVSSTPRLPSPMTSSPSVPASKHLAPRGLQPRGAQRH